MTDSSSSKLPTMITYNGIEYPTKRFNGYVFASDDLFMAISDPHGEILDDAVDIDRQIAFFFEKEEFDAMTGEELYWEFDSHS